MVSPPLHPNKRSVPFLTPVTEHDEAWDSRACYHLLSKEQRMPTGTVTNPALAQQLLDALDALSGLHPGFRPAHAKGLMCAGLFTPSPEAAHLTRAPHAHRPSTAVTVRYSNATGLPTIPDNDPARSGPRGIAIRFHRPQTLARVEYSAIADISAPSARLWQATSTVDEWSHACTAPTVNGHHNRS